MHDIYVCDRDVGGEGLVMSEETAEQPGGYYHGFIMDWDNEMKEHLGAELCVMCCSLLMDGM